MNRKSARPGYQHDTSVIGNLPQRLRKKIADKAKIGSVDGLENCYYNAAAVSAVANIDDEINNDDAVNRETTVVHGGVDGGGIAGVDYFLNYDRAANVVPCNIGTKAAAHKLVERHKLDEVNRKMMGLNNTKSENQLVKKQANTAAAATAIPGILRLNTTDHVRLAKTLPNIVGKTEERQRSYKVLKPKNAQHRNDMMMTASSTAGRDLLPIARSFTSKKYPTWFDDVQIESFCIELKQLYDTFTGLMQQNAIQEHWSYFSETRSQLLFIFKQIVLKHLKFCCETKCDSFFWKLLFYNVREFLKFSNVTQTKRDYLIELIDDGIAFYMDLIKCLKLKYIKTGETLNNASQNSSSSVLSSSSSTSMLKSDKFEVIAKVVAQKLLINLGDLCRYKVLHMKSNDFSEAANFYREAQILIPTNGIPYNQLAIVAIHDRKKFEAIYLHMRSLMSSNPIHSAKESLLVLFDEIRKKFEKTEPKISPLHQYKHTSNNSGNSSFNGKLISPLRKEVWIHPDGVRRLHRTNIDGRRSKLSKPAKNVEIRLDEMSSEDLLHRFISIYLYMIGKLYTGIGMETIQAHQNKLLTQLSALLKKAVTPLLLTRSKMLKIVALNIFILHHNVQQARREIRYYTFTFCNQMFGVFLQKCNQLFTSILDDTIDEKFEKRKGLNDLNTLLQFVKSYTDYLSLNVDIWEPIRKEEEYFIDPWNELQNLFENIESILLIQQQQKQYSKNDIILEEDQFLYGFMPLSTLQPKYYNANQTYASEAAQFFQRITLIKKFQAQFLDYAVKLQSEENDDADSSFVLEELDIEIQSALETLHKVDVRDDSETETITSNKSSTSSSSTTSTVATTASTVMENNTLPIEATVDQLAHLTKLKKELEQQTNAKRSYNAKLEEILNYVDTKVYIEVRPKYLMPDTNCFIDCLEDFEKLLKNYKRYTLVIPLTVVRELDGLSKGIKAESRPHFMQKHRIHHFDDVSTCAKRSLDFIKNTKQNVKCVTSKGSIINASLFALVEEEYMSNDDRILATALALSKTMCRETSKDDKCFIQTQLVLITTDRNLRVKALSRNLAVSELDEFLLWARDCNEP